MSLEGITLREINWSQRDQRCPVPLLEESEVPISTETESGVVGVGAGEGWGLGVSRGQRVLKRSGDGRCRGCQQCDPYEWPKGVFSVYFNTIKTLRGLVAWRWSPRECEGAWAVGTE